jgi:hypothetical protein
MLNQRVNDSATMASKQMHAFTVRHSDSMSLVTPFEVHCSEQNTKCTVQLLDLQRCALCAS